MSISKPKPFQFFAVPTPFEYTKTFATSQLPLQTNTFFQGPRVSLYDRYNRSDLRLDQCELSDIQVLKKQIIVAEAALSQELIEQISFEAQKKAERKFQTTTSFIPKKQVERQANTTSNFYKSEQISAECRQNQGLFNYKKIADEKKARQEKFLSTMENKIASIEKEAIELEHAQKQERDELHQICLLQEKVSRQLTANSYAGKVAQIVERALQDSGVENESELNLNVYMPQEEVNEVLEDHFKRNQDLLDQVYRVTQTGGVFKGKTNTSLNNTRTKDEKKERKLKSSKQLCSTVKGKK